MASAQPFSRGEGMHGRACEKPMSSPEFLHKEKAVVKKTRVKKVGKRGKDVESDYVNRKCIISPPPDCGKPLWKSLWRMWKTSSFQQLFRFCRTCPPVVENSVYRFA